MDELRAALLSDAQRLYRLEGSAPCDQLLVEAWAEQAVLNEPWSLELSALCPDPSLDLDALLLSPVALHTVLADGSSFTRNALVLGATSEDATHGLPRYRLQLGPWFALLRNSLHSRAWQDESLTTILDDVFSAYAPFATWRYEACVAPHLDRSPFLGTDGCTRPYVVQYRQSDLAFVQRLLREEGLVARFERDTDTLVILADTTSADSTPLDMSAAPLGGELRFHRADATEDSDTVQQLGAQRQLGLGRLSALASATRGGQSLAAAVVLADDTHGADLDPTPLEGYAPASPAHEGATVEQLERALDLTADGIQAHLKSWIGQSGVRSFTPGTRFTLTGSPLDAQLALPGADPKGLREFLLTGVIAVGLNNLPGSLSPDLVQLRDDANTPARGTPSRRQRTAARVLPEWISPALRRQATQSGYANRFAATRTRVPWRCAPCGMAYFANAAPEDVDRAPSLAAPQDRLPASLEDLHPHASSTSAVQPVAQTRAGHWPDDWKRLIPASAVPVGQPLYLKAGARAQDLPGALLATIVDAAGSGTDDRAAHMDALGRVRVRFDFQQGLDADGSTTRSSPWVRVAQAWAGDGHGAQFVPRLGQRVLVQCLHGDIEQPVVVASVYDGRGVGGVPRTPGGDAPESADAQAFASSHDHRSSAQDNLARDGHSPVWHGASATDDGHRNAAGITGLRSQAWDGAGYNQLVFDDAPTQLRVQLASTQHTSQLNLGHIIHTADNHRGSFRGTGFELRTDAYGALRAGQGLLITTAMTPAQEPAQDNTPGIALGKQLAQLAQSFDQAANTHKTPTLAAQQGTTKAAFSVMAGAKPEGPVPALLTSLKGAADAADFAQAQGDVAQRSTSVNDTRLPATGASALHLQGQAGIAAIAALDHVHSAGHAITEAAGQHIEQAVGGDLRIHTGQALAVTAGLIKAGSGAAGTGISLIAGQQDVQVQAQSDTLTLAAMKDVTVGSQSAGIDLAAAKKIVLKVGGGASLTIDSGGINFECPGNLTVKAGKKEFQRGGRVDYAMPTLPSQVCVACLLAAAKSAAPFSPKA
ncbi:type VI secretion system Vgr family protein [Roseateles sp. BYS87W]|uniref:Type VI secretion system Vgr family protein n=2 Tax=Pelomonas baiyunensis TaxID=3299026 RepID=A0ABW7H5A7_9BURK